jgi:Spy/CpxP family protein refolding chaperone
MNVWKIVCATLVIFVAGIVTGVVLMRLGERGPRPWNRPFHEGVTQPHIPTNPPLANPMHPSSPGNLAPMNREFVPLLERQLRLTAKQREEVEHIMKATQERIRALRSGIEPEIRKEMRQAQEQIRGVLTPEQLEQYQRLMKRQQKRDENSIPGDRRLREPLEPRNRPDYREPQPPREPGPPVEPEAANP